jgi:anti-sigma regulatory factor (Ser/Thr protein kinase)
MIDLTRNREGFLAEIEAPDPPSSPLSDITDPRVTTRDAHVRVCGHARDDLFPLLKVALLERFAAVPRLQLTRDLLMPLKNALGNACKHGNRDDPAKSVSVEIVLTRKGALIAVTDEGPGFDVARTFQRFKVQECYFANRGAGFRNLHEATSTVSYENGGRTVLLCFQPRMLDPDYASASHPVPASQLTTASTESRGEGRGRAELFDSGWIRTCLSAELAELSEGRAKLESCQVYTKRWQAGDDCGNRYVLRIAGHDGRAAKTRILTSRLHATAAAAEADFEGATRLYEANISKSLRIPRPVARLASEPRLVLYDFDPWMNLWEYLAYRGDLKAIRHCAERTGRALAKLHRSRVVLRGAEPDPVEELFQPTIDQAETTLQTLPCGREFVNWFRASAQRRRQRAVFEWQRPLAPIHGSLGWDCIYFDALGGFYLYRFERCQRSDPGVDVGGFAADLLCFTLANHDETTYRICRDGFLSHYNSKAEHRMDEDDLRFYTALAMVERLRRAEPRTGVDAGQLLGALEAAL